MSDQHKREGCAAGEGRQQEAAFAPLFNFPGAGFGEGDAGVGAQHGRHLPSARSAHAKKRTTSVENPRTQCALLVRDEILRGKNEQT